MARSVSFIIEADVLTEVTIAENLDGTLSFEINVLDGGLIGDLRALFFDLEGVASDSQLSVYGSSDVTDTEFDEAGVDSLGRDANIKGSVVNELGDFDVGVEFGTSGMSGDDIQTSSFVLAHDTLELSLDMIDLADFGIRYTSVGEEGGARNSSIKAGDQASGVARNDDLLVLENDAGSVDLLANDTNGGSVTVAGVADATGDFVAVAGGFERVVVINGLSLGTLVVGVDGVASFAADGADVDQHASGAMLELAFNYQTTAPDGSVATADAILTVQGVNDAPSLADGTIDAEEDGAAVTLDLSTLGADIDSDDDGGTLTYTVIGTPSEGSASVTGSVLAFDPGADFQDLDDGETRTVSIQVQATDAHGATATGTVSVTVTGANDGPVITSDVEETLGNVVEAVNNFSGNFVYDAGTPEATGTLSATGTGLVWSGSAAGLYGSFAIDSATGEWTYTLDARSQALFEGQLEDEIFQATVTDANGIAVSLDVTVAVEGRNDYPAVVAQTLSTTEDGGAVTFDLTTRGRDADSDDDGSTLTYELAAQPFVIGAFGTPVDGVATIVGTDLVYDPGDGWQELAEGETVQVIIPVRAIDSHGLTAQNNVYVNVTGANDAPTLEFLQSQTVDFDEISSTGSGVSVIGDVLELDGFVFTGYTPAGDFTGGNLGTMGSATSSSAYPGSAALTNRFTNGYTTIEREDGSAFDLTSIDLSESNDGQLSGSFTLLGTRADGTTVSQTVSKDGVFGFQTVALTGFDAVVEVRISGQGYHIDNVVADVSGGHLLAAEDGPSVDLDLSIFGDDIDSDDDGTTLTYSVIGAPAEGGASISGTVLTFDPGAGFQDLNDGETRDVDIIVQATDAHGATATGTVTVTVTGSDDNVGPRFVAAYSARLTEDDAPNPLSATGRLEFSDANLNDRPEVTVAFYDAGWSKGADTLSAAQKAALDTGLVLTPYATNTNTGTVEFTYSIDPSVIDFIADGETVSVIYQATVTDEAGETDTTIASVYITGTNDAPIIGAEVRSPGDPDIVWAQNTNLGNFVALNDGNAVFSEGHELATQSRLIDVALGDLDGDGDLDIFGSNSSSANVAYLNDGEGNFSLNGQINLAVGSNMSNSLGDLDGDGDLDAYVVRQSSQSDVILLNDGTGQFTQAATSHGTGTYLHVELGDIDGDGDLDAVRSSYTGGVSWALNDGAGNFTDAGPAIGTDRTSGAVELVDIDGDGDLDIISAGYYDYTTSSSGTGNRVYLNDGNANFSDTGQSLGSGRTMDVTAGDVDGDGDADVIFANVDGSNRLYLNDGAGNLVDAGQDLGTGVTEAIELADLDGDGDLDLIVGDTDPNTQFGVGYGQNRILFNDGSGVFTDSGQPIATVATRAIAVGDLDGDGPASFSGSVTEILDGEAGEDTADLTANGTIAFSDVDVSDTHSASFVPQGGGYLGTFQLGAPTTSGDITDGTLDWDFSVSDAALDHLVAGEALAQTYDITIDDGNGGTATTSVTITLNGADDASPILSAPVNIMSTGTTGGARMITVAQDGTLVEADFLANNGGFAYGTAMGDINGDGLDDVLMSGDWSGAAIYYADGAGGFTNSGVNIAGQFQSNVEIADIDNDGDGDLYLQNGQGATEIWQNDGGSFSNVFSYTNIGSSGTFRTSGDAEFADVNGDGAVDMLINQIEDSIPIADSLFLNDGSGNFTASGQVLPTMTGYSSARLADVNNDGSVDYVTGTASGLFVALNDGTGNFTTTAADLGPVFNGDIELADFNGDGFLDALRHDPDGGSGLELWLGDGSDQFAFDSLISLSTSGYGGGVSVGDFTGDGIADVIQVSGGAVHALANDGLGNFTEADALALSGFIFGEELGFV